MKSSEKLLVLASWLENSENDLLVSASDDVLESVAGALVKAAELLKSEANEISKLEPTAEAGLTPEKIDELAALAQSFDESGDEKLQKQASVLDEILLTIAAPRNYLEQVKKADDLRMEELKKKYKSIKEEHNEVNKVADAVKEIENSPYYKEYKTLEAPLKARNCPDHPGQQMARIGDDVYQCSLDRKEYDFTNGYTTLKGNKVPGGDVSGQTPKNWDYGDQIFDSRNDRLGNK